MGETSIVGPQVQINQGRRGNLLVGGVRLNLSEFTWLGSCSMVTDHYIFQCLKAMSSGYLQEVRAGG